MKLRPYQEQGISKLLEILKARNSAYLADSMGLGKTAQAIVVTRKLCPGPTLIVCPASLRLNWKKEWYLWNEKADVSVILSGKDIEKSSNAFIVIVSYDMASRKKCLDMLRGRRWSMLILDEAHACKSLKALRTRACLKILWDKADYRLALSGTPFPNGIIDGFTLFNRMAPEMFPDYYKFGFKYTQAEKNWFTQKWEFKGGKNLKELKTKIKSTFLVRRTKEQVLKELPPKIYSTIPLEVKGVTDEMRLSPEALEAVTEALKQGSVAFLSDSNPTQRRALGLLKVPAIIEYVKTILEEKKKVVIFAYHRAVVEALQVALKDFGIVTLHGGTTPSNKQRAVDDFQTKDEIKIFLGQIAAAGSGITLTASDCCIFAEFSWTPADMAQAQDRLHRLGQTSVVEVHYLAAVRSMDEQVIGVLAEKIKCIDEVLR